VLFECFDGIHDALFCSRLADIGSRTCSGGTPNFVNNPWKSVDEEQYAYPPGITPLTTYRSRGEIGGLADVAAQFCEAGRPPRSGPQIEVPLRLQFRDPDHAALVGADEPRQQILQRNILEFHAVAACGEFKAGFGKLADAPGSLMPSETPATPGHAPRVRS
jgi:hypothetical protein